MKLPGYGHFAPATSALLLAGCVTVTSSRAESWIPEDRVARIVRAQTTRKEIMEWFGPPVAVARRGEVLQMPRMKMRRISSQEVQADTFFELFADRVAAGENDVLYFYESAEIRGSGISFLGAGSVSGEVRENRLWILVDGATGKVRDFVHRHGEDRPQPAEPNPADSVSRVGGL